MPKYQSKSVLSEKLPQYCVSTVLSMLQCLQHNNQYTLIGMPGQFLCQLHPDEPLQLICLNSHCQQKGLICYLCQLEHHNKHSPIISFSLFLDSFLHRKSKETHFATETALIDQHLLLIQRRLDRLRYNFQDFAIVQQTFGKFWKQTVQEITHYDCLVKELEHLLSGKKDQTCKELNSWILKHQGLFQAEKEDTEKENTFVGYLKNKLTSLTVIAESIEKYELRGRFQESDILNLFKMQIALAKLRLHFSDQLKGVCMTILSPTKASMTMSGSQRMILLQPALSNGKGLKVWRVKIQKLASWIGVGVAHLDSIKSANFDFSYTNTNHGNYLISSNGYSWNGYKMEFNSKFQPFQFTTGDTIEVTYDPANNKVSFQKQNHDKIFTYDIDPTQKPIHAAINMTGIGDCVQILQ